MDNYRIYGLTIVKTTKNLLMLDYGFSNATFDTPNHVFTPQISSTCHLRPLSNLDNLLHVSSSPKTRAPLFFWVYASKTLDSFFKHLTLGEHGARFISWTPLISTCLTTLVAFFPSTLKHISHNKLHTLPNQGHPHEANKSHLVQIFCWSTN